MTWSARLSSAAVKLLEAVQFTAAMLLIGLPASLIWHAHGDLLAGAAAVVSVMVGMGFLRQIVRREMVDELREGLTNATIVLEFDDVDDGALAFRTLTIRRVK